LVARSQRLVDQGGSSNVPPRSVRERKAEFVLLAQRSALVHVGSVDCPAGDVCAWIVHILGL
jgi:hypothetical protein